MTVMYVLVYLGTLRLGWVRINTAILSFVGGRQLTGKVPALLRWAQWPKMTISC